MSPAGRARTDIATAGTGLGLAIAKSLVELHGGRIWVESEVGRGSRSCSLFQAEIARALDATGSGASYKRHPPAARLLVGQAQRAGKTHRGI